MASDIRRIGAGVSNSCVCISRIRHSSDRNRNVEVDGMPVALHTHEWTDLAAATSGGGAADNMWRMDAGGH